MDYAELPSKNQNRRLLRHLVGRFTYFTAMAIYWREVSHLEQIQENPTAARSARRMMRQYAIAARGFSLSINQALDQF